jgi:hypothetical protein
MVVVANAPSPAAGGEAAVGGAVVIGVDSDVTVIGRLMAGALYRFGRLAPEAHLTFDGFLRAKDAGISARSFGLLELGGRYALRRDRFVGPFVTTGASIGVFTGKPHQRVVVDDAEVCGSAAGMPHACDFNIDKNIAIRAGFGWGFASGGAATVAIRLDVVYWLFSVNAFEDQPSGAPIPREIPRPQDTWSVLVGLEFLRWL